jgi:hypothetical protein
MNWAADRGRQLVSDRGAEPSWVEATGLASGRSEPARPKKTSAAKARPAKKATPATKPGGAKTAKTAKKATPTKRAVSAKATPVKRTAGAASSQAGHPNRQRSTLVNDRINAEYHQLGAQLRDGHLKAAEAATRRLAELIAAARSAQVPATPRHGKLAAADRNNVGRRA